MRGPKTSTNICFLTAATATIANNSFNNREKILFASFTYDLPKPRCFVQTMLPCFDPVVATNVLRYLNLKWSQLRPDGLEFFTDFLHFLSLSIGFVCSALRRRTSWRTSEHMHEIERMREWEQNCLHAQFTNDHFSYGRRFFSCFDQCEYNFSQQLIVIFLI